MVVLGCGVVAQKGEVSVIVGRKGDELGLNLTVSFGGGEGFKSGDDIVLPELRLTSEDSLRGAGDFGDFGGGGRVQSLC
jgi:hypothetical protein